MTEVPNWWQKPRSISVVVDNPSWILPFAEDFVETLTMHGERAMLCRAHNDILTDGIAFYLGCIKITPPAVLRRNYRNLVVHASDLPKGRGFSPLTWRILEGANQLPVCLLEAAEEVDAGAIIFQDTITFVGHELVDELRTILGAKSIELCARFLQLKQPECGRPQEGEPTVYKRRRPEDSRLDPLKTIAEQFELLRVVDNHNYPAFFDWRGHRYKMLIEKCSEDNQK